MCMSLFGACALIRCVTQCDIAHVVAAAKLRRLLLQCAQALFWAWSHALPVNLQRPRGDAARLPSAAPGAIPSAKQLALTHSSPSSSSSTGSSSAGSSSEGAGTAADLPGKSSSLPVGSASMDGVRDRAAATASLAEEHRQSAQPGPPRKVVGFRGLPWRNSAEEQVGRVAAVHVQSCNSAYP